MEAKQTARRRRRWPWVCASIAVVYICCCLLSPVRWTTTETEKHAGGIEIRTTTLHELTAYIGMADNGTCLILPIPYYHIIKDYQRVLLRNGQEEFASGEGDLVDIHPSPSGSYVVVQPRLYTKPLKIHASGKDSWVELVVPQEEFPEHYYVYPFRFLRWDGEGAFLVEVAGFDFRQMWKVDAESLVRSRIE